MPRVAKQLLVVPSLMLATILLTVPRVGTADAGNHRDFAGAVYTMTNDASGNAVIMFRRTERGLV